MDTWTKVKLCNIFENVSIKDRPNEDVLSIIQSKGNVLRSLRNTHIWVLLFLSIVATKFLLCGMKYSYMGIAKLLGLKTVDYQYTVRLFIQCTK